MSNIASLKKVFLMDLQCSGHGTIAGKVTSITSKKYSGGSSMRVRATNLTKTERETLEAFAREYTDRSFDGMTDSYTYHECKKPYSFGFAFVDLEYSDAYTSAVRTILKHEWDIVDDETAQKKMSVWYDVAIHRIRSQCEDIAELCERANGYLNTPTITEEIATLEPATEITMCEMCKVVAVEGAYAFCPTCLAIHRQREACVECSRSGVMCLNCTMQTKNDAEENELIKEVDPTKSCVKCGAIVDTFVHKVRHGHCPSCHEAIVQFVEPAILLDRISTRPTAKENYENYKQPNLFEIGRND